MQSSRSEQHVILSTSILGVTEDDTTTFFLCQGNLLSQSTTVNGTFSYVSADYSCALQRDILLQGRLYLSENWICFYSNIFRWETLVRAFSLSHSHPHSSLVPLCCRACFRTMPEMLPLDTPCPFLIPLSNPLCFVYS